MTESQEKKQNVTIIKDDDKNTQLHYATAAGDDISVSEEIGNGHKIDIENYLGWTPLMMAVKNGHTDLVKLLIQKYRADATRKNKFGLTVFHVGVSSGKLDIVEFLLQHLLCGGISRQSIQKIFSPISIAILFNQMDIVEHLVNMSFDINCTVPITRITPLMIASAMELKEIYSFLLKNGANPNHKNILGHTADTQAKRRRVQQKELHCTTPRIPMVIFNSQPMMHFQDPQLINCPSRNSSSTLSPNFIPNMTPITPIGFCPQYFFPPDFSPNNPFLAVNPIPGVSPVFPNNYNTNDLMNMKINEHVFLTPVQHKNFPTSPCA